MKPLAFLIAAGGTGGHLLPALSLAKALKDVSPEAKFLFVGAGKPIEEKILAPENFCRAVIKTSGIKGRGIVGKIKALAECAAGVWEARKIIREFKPDLVVGAGGYVTVPVGIASKLCGAPLALHEQNSRPGLSNRVLAKMAKVVMLGFAEAAPAFGNAKTVVTGNPVRPEIVELAGMDRDFKAEKARILITGGSQGARALNDVASKALAILAEKKILFTVVHQTGEADREAMKKFYGEKGIENNTAAFFQNMAAIYGATDLVISRAGAATIAELAAAKLPSILVPLPTAADDHQTVNAKSLSERGAAILMPQKDLTPELLAETLAGLLGDRERLQKMSDAVLLASHPVADRVMARIAIKVLKGDY